MNASGKYALVCIFIVMPAAICGAQEKKIKRSDLPVPVEKTVEVESRGATIRGFSKEKQNSATYYELEMTVNGHERDVLIEQTGAIAEVEEEVAIGALPPAVRDGLMAKAGKGKIAKVESITKHDKLVAYEADVVRAGKKYEVQVGPDGKPLNHEE